MLLGGRCIPVLHRFLPVEQPSIVLIEVQLCKLVLLTVISKVLILGNPHPTLLQLALSWPGGPFASHLGRISCFSPYSLPFPSPHFLYVLGLKCYHLLIENNIRWIFIYSFEMLMRLSCFPLSPTLGTLHTLILWSVWRGKAYGSHVPVCIVAPVRTAYSCTK